MSGKQIYPLPRIGSKEWGWRHNKTEHTMDSSKCCYVVLCRNKRELADVWHAEGGPAVEGIEDNETAKRIAELLARRDWRKENGKR